MEEGDPGDTLFVVLTGSVRSFAADWDGREITYNIWGPNSLIGEMALDGGPRSASVITLEPTECAVIRLDAFKSYVLANPELAWPLITLIIRRARDATISARNLALLDVYGRLRVFLSSAPFDEVNAERVLVRHLSQKEIAQNIGSSREMVSRLLKDLERGGYIRTARGVLTILRPLPERW